MTNDNRKVALIGTGMVGMSFAYALLNQGACNELVLIDVNKARANGEASDLNHGLAFAQSPMQIYAGDYKDLKDADIAVVCAGAAQKPGETRLDLLRRNAQIMKSIIEPCVENGFDGIFLIASNPVDIMTRLACDLSGFDSNRVIGSGTTLDSARLRYLIGKFFDIDTRNVHAYVCGEHGDSEFVPWSQAMIATKRVVDVCRDQRIPFKEVAPIEDEVKNAAYSIIDAKGATYYGIGMALVRIVKAIFGDENSVLTVSTKLKGEYGINGPYLGIPCYVNRQGVKRTLALDFSSEEIARLRASAKLCDTFYDKLEVKEKFVAK